MSNVKAVIGLASGNVGFYDNLTKIHLTIASPRAKVFEGMNTTNIENGVRCKTIEVIEGSLFSTPVVEDEPPVIIEEPKAEKKAEIKEEVTEHQEVVVEEPKEVKVEEEIAAVEEEVKEAPKARKRTSKKAAAKENESSTEESK